MLLSLFVENKGLKQYQQKYWKQTPVLQDVGSTVEIIFEENVSRLPVDEFDMWTPKNGHVDTPRAPKKHEMWGHVLMQMW